RLQEVAQARWREMTKLDQPGEALFTVPEGRFKSETPHLVPLSQAALDVLAACPRFRTGDVIFSLSFGAKPANNYDRCLQRLRKLMVERIRETDPDYEMEHMQPHDFRQAIRSHLSMMRVPEHVCEAVIGHGRKGLARVYSVHSMLPEIREALDAWALR